MVPKRPYLRAFVFSIFLIISAVSFAQTVDTTVTSADYQWYQVDTKTWTFQTPADTLSAKSGSTQDTVVVGVGDTLFYDYPDTVIINFPHNFGTGFVGAATVNMDDIQTFTDLTGTFAIQTAQCETCRWTTEVSTALPAVTATTRVMFEVRNIKMRCLIIATGGFGTADAEITLKPASITKS